MAPIELPANFFVNSIEEKEVILFRASKETVDPHFYICIKKTKEDVLMLALSTTQKERILKFVSINNCHPDTIVEIKPNSEDSDSVFNKHCYVNCNDVYPYTSEELKTMHDKGLLKPIGILHQKYYEAIVNGICLSQLVDNDFQDLLNSTD